MKRSAELTLQVDVSPALNLMNFVDALYRSRRLTRRIEAVTQHPLTPTDLRALRLVAPAPVTISGAATLLNVDLSRASRHLARLVDLGLLDRQPHPKDARFSNVKLSGEGHEVLRLWFAYWEEAYLSATQDWPETDLARFGELTGRFHRAQLKKRVEPDVRGGPAPARWYPRLEPASNESRAKLLLPLFDFVDFAFTRAGSPTAADDLMERARSPVGPTLVRVLSLVANRGPLGITELAERTGVVPSRTSRHVQQLEEHQFVLRAVDPHDRRSSRIKATSKGLALLRRIQTTGEAGMAENVMDWAETDVVELMAYFRRLTTGISGRLTGWSEQVAELRVGAPRPRGPISFAPALQY